MNSIARKARVVLVGAGRMGQIRAKILMNSPLFELVGIADTLDAQTLASKHGVDAYESLAAAIATNSKSSPLDGVIVSSPTFSHGDIIKEAADSNLSIFTEKPVDETADEIESLFLYTERSGVALCCGFQRRFDPSYVAGMKAVHEGYIGSPVAAQIFFADHPVPHLDFLLKGGNIFMDLSAHDVDYIMHTLQDYVVSVYATGSSSDVSLAKAGIFDNATLVMKFSRGASASLFMSRSAIYGYDQRCEVFGSEGLISVQNEHETSTILSNASGVHRARLLHSFPERFRAAFEAEMNAFADVLMKNSQWPVTRAQCINVQRVADAATESSETGKVIPVGHYKSG